MWFSANQDNMDMVHPALYGTKHARFFKIFAQVSFWLTIGLQASALSFVILFMATPNSVSPGDEQFELYKNSRFKACAAQPLGGINCTAYLDTFQRCSTDVDDQDECQKALSFERSGWCDHVWCFRDFKATPSAIPSKVLVRGHLLQWWFLGITVMSTAYYFRKLLLSFDAHYPSQCKDKGTVMMLSLLYSLVSVVWWFRDFGAVLAGGFLPVSLTTLSNLSWVLTWRTAQSLRRHPLLCAFHSYGRLRRVFVIMLYVLALIQFGVSLYLISQTTSVPYKNYYQCLEQK